MLKDLYRLLRNGHVQAQGIVDTMTQPIVVLDQNLSVTMANNAFLRVFQVSREGVLGQNFFTLGNGQWENPALRQLIESVIPKSAAVAGFEVSHTFPLIGERSFLVDARRLVHPDDNNTHMLIHFTDVTEQRHLDAERTFILSEMRHRMKNLLAVVRSVATNTASEDRSGSEFRNIFLGRLEVALKGQHIALSRELTDIETLVRQSVGAVGAERLSYQGPAVSISGPKVLTMSMILHELTTNAVKYGALSVPDGQVKVTWSIENGPRDQTLLSCEWREINGPAVAPPTRKGYGTNLIEGISAHVGGSADLSYSPAGLAASIKIPV